MAPKGYLSPDTEDFFTSFEELFTEASHKGFKSNDDRKILRTGIANFLFQCAATTVSKARSNNPVLLPDGSQPGVTLARPPSWLKINEKQRQALVKATKTDKFFDLLRKYTTQQSSSRETPSAKRPTGRPASQPAPKRQKVDQTPQQAVRPKVNPAAIKKGTASTAPECDGSDNEPSETGQEPASPLMPNHAAKSEGSLLPVPTVVNKDNQEASRDNAEDSSEKPTSNDDHETKIKKETMSPGADKIQENPSNCGHSQEAAESPEEDRSTTAVLPEPTGGLGNNGEEEDENDRMSQFNNVFGEHKVENDTNTQQPFTPPTAEEVVSMVRDLTSEIESVEPSSWEDYKPRLIQHLRYLGMEHFVPCEPLGPAVAGDPTKGLNVMLASYGEELAKIPSDDWDHIYQPELARLCASDEILQMSFQQRLSKIGRIVYLKEEEAVLASGDWDRLKSAVRLCAVLAQATGPETEDDQSLAEMYTASRFRDIMWLEKAVKARGAIREMPQQASDAGQCAGI